MTKQILLLSNSPSILCYAMILFHILLASCVKVKSGLYAYEIENGGYPRRKINFSTLYKKKGSDKIPIITVHAEAGKVFAFELKTDQESIAIHDLDKDGVFEQILVFDKNFNLTQMYCIKQGKLISDDSKMIKKFNISKRIVDAIFNEIEKIKQNENPKQKASSP